jgi:antirestriction protein ArdC
MVWFPYKVQNARSREHVMAGRGPRLSEDERTARIAELKAQLDATVASLDSEERWEEFLRTISQFGTKYSVNNQLLIMVQAADKGFDPQLVMGFNAWKARGRSVIKGQTGIKIWAPCFRYPTEAEIAKAVADGHPLRRDPADPSRYAKILAGYRIEHVFDVCQTEGDEVEIPAPIIERVRVRVSGPSPELLTGEDVAGAWDAVVTQIHAHDYRVERGHCGGANGYTDPFTKLVKVRDDVSPAQALKTLVHELAHIVCKHVDDMAEYLLHRGRQETEAESVAFVVCGALGLDTGQYSAPYVRTWSNGDPEVLAAAADLVARAAARILRGLDEVAGSVEQVAA